MPTTPGVPGRLAKVAAEAAKVAADRMPGSVLLTEPDIADGDPNGTAELLPTKANVLAYLPGCSIAHFACHGESDPTGPSRSLLLLHDHNSDPLTVASLAPIRLGQAQLAFLSACHAMSIRVSALLDEPSTWPPRSSLPDFPASSALGPTRSPMLRRPPYSAPENILTLVNGEPELRPRAGDTGYVTDWC